MNKNDELAVELAKNKADEFVVKKELEIAKRDFINSLQNDFGEEIKTTNNSYYIKPDSNTFQFSSKTIDI